VSVDRDASAGLVPAAARAERIVRLAQAGVAGSVLLFAFTALLGPSWAEPALPGTGPLRALSVAPHPWVITVSLWLAIASGAVGVGCAWAALVRGWRPALNRVWGWGAVSATVLALVPPLGSSDITNYAVYGRLAALGLSPYRGSADELAHLGDPVGLGYAGVWHSTPSVYGPVATMWQYVTSLLTGSSMRMFVIMTQLAALGLFLASGWMLDRVVRDRPVERLRVAMLWTANPLLVYLLVNSAHVDVLATFLGVVAIALLRRSPAAAGVFAALATCTKVSFILYAIAFAWALRQRSRDVKVYLFAVVVTTVIVVAPFAPEIFGPLSIASKYVSHESPWHTALAPMNALLSSDVAHRLLDAAAWLLIAILVWRLSALLPKPRSMASDPGRSGAWAAVVLSMAWLLCSPYFFAWYDAMAWAPLVLIPASRLDLLLLARTGWVSVASVPGLEGHPAGSLGSLTTFVTNTLAPGVGIVLILLVLFSGDRLLTEKAHASR
jgi:hypothetical protein